MKVLCVLVLVLAATALAERRRYDGYQVWEIDPIHIHDKQLAQMEENGLIDRMGYEILVAPEDILAVHKTMKLSGIVYTIQNEDIQRELDAAYAQSDLSKAYDKGIYNTLTDIMAEIDRLASQDCPSGFTCDSYSIGTSGEGRDLRVLSVTQGSGRPALWFDSLIHCREWLAGATHMRVIDELLNGYGTNADSTWMLDNFDFYFFPVHNPDGYAYTHTNDRMWRKNRRTNSGSSCRGVDLNRNYNDRWSQPGASSNPCSETFYGPSAASEPETQAAQNEATRLLGSLVAHTTIHTVVPAWLTPYGDCTTPPNNADIMQVSRAAVNAIQDTHNTNWDVGNSCQVLYSTSGTTSDWARRQGIPYTWTPELRGPGFTPGTSAIQPSYEEMFNGFVAMAREIASIGYAKKTVL